MRGGVGVGNTGGSAAHRTPHAHASPRPQTSVCSKLVEFVGTVNADGSLSEVSGPPSSYVCALEALGRIPSTYPPNPLPPRFHHGSTSCTAGGPRKCVWRVVRHGDVQRARAARQRRICEAVLTPPGRLRPACLPSSHLFAQVKTQVFGESRLRCCARAPSRLYAKARDHDDHDRSCMSS